MANVKHKKISFLKKRLIHNKSRYPDIQNDSPLPSFQPEEVVLGGRSNFLIIFIVFYVVIGTLSQAAKIILELLLRNDKPQAFSEGEIPPLNSPPPKGETPSNTSIINRLQEIPINPKLILVRSTGGA